MMKILFIIPIAWVFIYLYRISSHGFYLFRCTQLLKTLQKLWEKASKEDGDTETNFVNLAMPYAPEVGRILDWNICVNISHIFDVQTNMRNWRTNIAYLADEIDDARNDLHWSLNPGPAFRILLHTPAWLFVQLGFKFKPKTNKIISFLGWLIAFAGSIYSEEIKNVISKIWP